MQSNYDKHPYVPVRSSAQECSVGWDAIAGRLLAEMRGDNPVLCVECYPGVFEDQVCQALAARLHPTCTIRTSECLKPPAEIDRMLARDLTGDPVFGRLNGIVLRDYFDAERLHQTRQCIESVPGPVLVVGVGAALIAAHPALVVYADLARWEIQQRQRRGEIGNLGAANLHEKASLKYKRGFFADWRAADRLKKTLLPRLDFLLDTNHPSEPKLISGDHLREGLRTAAGRPFRVVPFFDPGPWGGQWMRDVCGLPIDAPNYAWCFDCVPEENSLLLGFGGLRVEIPAIDLVFMQPRPLLGEAVHARFGTEFPIRFDFLDTMGGGNLSLQVHPLTEYVQDRFGMHYTQDESYYMLDASPDACVFLGLRENVDPAAMMTALRAAQQGGCPFPAERFVNQWPARKHDHFLIPAGTVHCSGSNCMVLEISATPYIFTFKLWDWDRPGLDGKPRPVHLDHGERNIAWDRTTAWVRNELINRVEPLAAGPAWREERTGLHRREFIETRRHWFIGDVHHDTGGGVNVLNLVEGEAAIVESPAGAFQPLLVHYAETFIVPAAVGPYTIRPTGTRECATLKAFVRA